jgi:predicted component of type VI protein secretion system
LFLSVLILIVSLETTEGGTFHMKVQLVVVRGKPEGKVIPLVGQSFKIGRGETCHLRPNSEQVSREHAEFTINGDTVSVRDLGSRNGTLVNGKALTADACRLKDRDLVQVGPLTFAVAILGVPAPAARPAASPAPPKPASPDDVSGDDIDSWLIGPNSASTADQPTAVYGGDTITIAAFKDASAAPPKPAAVAVPAQPPSVSDDEYERQPDDETEEESDEPFDQDEEEEETVDEGESGPADEIPEEFLDPSNPFYAAKKAQKEQAKQTGPVKEVYKDTSDAASDILRRLMERRRAERSS